MYHFVLNPSALNMGASNHSALKMDDRWALEQRRERNRMAQRKHRENARRSMKGTKLQEENRDSRDSKTPPEQNSHPTATRGSRSPTSNGQDMMFSAFLGPGLEYGVDHHMAAESSFSNMLFSSHEYSHMVPTSPLMPLDQQVEPDLQPYSLDSMYTDPSNKATFTPSLCDLCYAYAKPQSPPHQDPRAPVTSPANTPTRPTSQPKGSDSARIPGAGSRTWTTPLHISITRGHLSAVRLLLDRGADPNAVDGAGSTVLHTAVQSGHHAIVRELLRHHADPTSVDAAGWQPLHYAADSGDENCLRALLQASGE
ncbi:hypothetical protein BDV25DRAFT_156708 [Aspergillus avenaceus]|uniref:Uncharacterized protein n=1 Tax=Aspergillus avenaceus TaxID=36643 RepID=A0A5N6TS93_ASPAV|nr:hypothetical protein BDV25DRAFT_156708 [Aspergillus avenaceus]